MMIHRAAIQRAICSFMMSPILIAARDIDICCRYLLLLKRCYKLVGQ